MKINHKLIQALTIVFAFFVTQDALPQQILLDTLLKKFDSHRKQNLQENIFVHTDRNFYLTGETLWFKVYNTDASFHQPLDVNKVAYIEILDQSKTPLLQIKTALKEGSGNGHVFLPASLSSGNYLLRAYTHWMKNYSPDLFFQKSITIVNPFIKLNTERTANTSQHIITFFPEGGDLVYGLKSKVAFKLTDKLGKGISGYGAVINQHNDTIATFEPLTHGLGNFYLRPEEDQQYKVLIKNADGKIVTHPFPEIKKSGYVMNVETKKDQTIEVNISAQLQSIPNPSFVYLFIHARQIMVKAETKVLQDKQVSFSFSKEILQEGINHITIFDTQLNPVCERLYFKQPKQKLLLNVASNQKEYSTRRKVTLDLTTATANQQTVSADLSVSVYKVDSLDQNSTDNIFEYLWFSAELKGNIESPSYYFSSNDSLVQKASDNLMLTHGWRRFSWSDVLHNKNNIAFLPEYRGHLIKGKVLSADGTPARGILTYMATPGKVVRLYGSRSNAQGEIYFEVKDFYNQRNLIVQTDTERDSTYAIKIDSPFSNATPTYTLPALQLSPAFADALVTRSIAMQVQDIYYGENQNFSKANAIDSMAFYGQADERYNLDDYTRFPVMEEVMREYVPGVIVRKRKDGFHFMVLDKQRRGVLSEKPMVLLDGVPVFDVDKIMAFDPTKIKSLEVVTRQYYLGPLSLPGIVSYATYQGDLAGLDLNPKAVRLNYEGLQQQREFFTPNYQTQNERKSRMPDQRNLLLWAPHVKTDSTGKQQIEFYTSDIVGEYQVVIQGLSKKGVAGNGLFTFIVKRFEN